ncbi:MAG: hypothetical protein HOB73_01035 [Planctomycetaceae bacterium]|jgi:hypothetical protein|nr:hypothetical protein [Planctomycetaceae bacterium]
MLCPSNGEQLGYFKALVTGDKVRTRLSQNYRYNIYVSDVGGGTCDKPNYGVNFLVSQFLGNLREGAEGYIEEMLAKEGLTPLDHPNPDVLERTEVRRIFT